MFKGGFPLQIRRQNTTPHSNSVLMEPRHGLHEVQRFKIGIQRDLFYGYMANVCMSPTSFYGMS
jgi:hypothetical protein